jgi:type VI secretion system protein ImpM
MRCGLYGKLPSKRDFISIATPRHFLYVWEPWIANCLAQSRTTLGQPNWERVFSEAPIWRFFLGAELCGSSLFGALMPSVDAIGRYFPLTLVAQTELDSAVSTPDSDPCQTWFDAAEEFLLSLLDADLPWEAVDIGLKNLGLKNLGALNGESVPQNASANAAAEAKLEFTGLDEAGTGARPLGEIFATVRQHNDAPVAALNCWWTLGSENYRPRAFVQKSMPDPLQFAAMLTEQFVWRPPETSQSG